MFDLFDHIENRKRDVYDRLESYFLHHEIDSVFDVNKEIIIDFSWKSLNPMTIKVISDSEARSIIQRASNTIIRVTYTGLFRRRKEEVIRKSDTSNVVIRTSRPLFIKKEYCLMAYSVSYGETNGYYCLYLYKKYADGHWHKEKLVISKVS